MNIVRIEGPNEALGAVLAMPQAIVFAGKDLEPGRGQLSAYVETADIPTIEGLGTSVTVLVSEADRDAQIAALYAQLDDEKPRTA